MTRRPPFANLVAELEPMAYAAQLWCFHGSEAWSAAQRWNDARAHHQGPSPAILLPPGDDANNYRWEFVADWRVLAVEAGVSADREAQGIALACLDAGAAEVHALLGAPDYRQVVYSLPALEFAA